MLPPLRTAQNIALETEEVCMKKEETGGVRKTVKVSEKQFFSLSQPLKKIKSLRKSFSPCKVTTKTSVINFIALDIIEFVVDHLLQKLGKTEKNWAY